MAGDVDVTTSDRYVELELHDRLEKVGQVLKSDMITLVAPMYSGIDQLVRAVVEEIADEEGERRSEDLTVILETDGGSIEVVERIAHVLRHHYANGEINFVIPDRAMSAGTVLVMCGDNILMDYYSVLGPIDPQVPSATNGNYVPALGYLAKYDELVEKSRQGTLTAAEMAFMVQKFDPAELDFFGKARDLSNVLLEDWLATYKFKNWVETEERGLPVSDDMKKERAKEIGEKLNKTNLWKTHSRGISMEVLTRELKLVIEDFGANDDKRESISSYYRLLQDYMRRRGTNVAIQNNKSMNLQ